MDTVNLMSLPDIDSTSSSVVKKEDLLHTVLFHFAMWAVAVIGSNCFLEEFYIRTLVPKINDGLKASCELILFK